MDLRVRAMDRLIRTSLTARMSTHHALTLTLVIGGTGKTGRRIVDRLRARGVPSARAPVPARRRSTGRTVRRGRPPCAARPPPTCPTTRISPCPGAAATVGAFAELAVECGVRRLVLLSGRGEEEAQRAEQLVQAAGRRLDDRALQLVRPELQRELLRRARRGGRAGAARGRRRRAVRRRRRHRRRGRRGADRGRPRGAALRADRAAAADVRRRGRGDRRRQRPAARASCR